jgi:hypothetical protein
MSFGFSGCSMAILCRLGLGAAGFTRMRGLCFGLAVSATDPEKK